MASCPCRVAQSWSPDRHASRLPQVAASTAVRVTVSALLQASMHRHLLNIQRLQTLLALPAAQVQAFGSYVNKLGAHDSDLDVVVTGLLEPDHPENGGGISVRSQGYKQLQTNHSGNMQVGFHRPAGARQKKNKAPKTEASIQRLDRKADRTSQ